MVIIYPYTDIVKPDIDCLPKKSCSDDSVQWGITYNRHYKLLIKKDSYVKYFIHQCGKKRLEYSHDGRNLVLSITYQDGIEMTHMRHILHLET